MHEIQDMNEYVFLHRICAIIS